jgi:hypothetical protein
MVPVLESSSLFTTIVMPGAEKLLVLYSSWRSREIRRD